MGGHARMVRSLAGDHGASVDAQDKYGFTPLHIAASMNKLEAAAALLEHMADAALRNEAGQTALEVAEAKGSDAVALLLLRDHSAGLAAAAAQPAPAPAPVPQPAVEQGVPPPEQVALAQLVAMMALGPVPPSPVSGRTLASSNFKAAYTKAKAPNDLMKLGGKLSFLIRCYCATHNIEYDDDEGECVDLLLPSTQTWSCRHRECFLF